MSRADVAGGTIGAGMAAGPSVVQKVMEVPFYETSAWLTGIAALGGFVLAGTAINVAFKVYINYKEAHKQWNGQERRGRGN